MIVRSRDSPPCRESTVLRIEEVRHRIRLAKRLTCVVFDFVLNVGPIVGPELESFRVDSLCVCGICGQGITVGSGGGRVASRKNIFKIWNWLNVGRVNALLTLLFEQGSSGIPIHAGLRIAEVV